MPTPAPKIAATLPGPAAARPGRASTWQAAELGVAGAIGAVCGLYWYVELVVASSLLVRDLFAGLAIGGATGFAVNLAGPLRDGAPSEAARRASWGGMAGAIGGAVGLVLGELVLGGFRGGVLGRSISWGILGFGIGASQGLAIRSRQALLHGVLGGTIGGFVGGFLFENIRSSFSSRPEIGQGLGMVALGGGVGLGLSLVERALRRAWIVVANGRQEGRSYPLVRKVCTIGLDERADVGLFGDPEVARRHAEIEVDGGRYLMIDRDPEHRTKLNGDPIAGPRPLSDGDRIELGRTSLIFRRRGGRS